MCVSGAQEAVDWADHFVAMWNGECAAWTEINLYIDDDECYRRIRHGCYIRTDGECSVDRPI